MYKICIKKIGEFCKLTSFYSDEFLHLTSFVFTIIINGLKNKLNKIDNEIDSINLHSGEQMISCTSNIQKKRKKTSSKEEINVLITNVNKDEFLKLENKNYLKYLNCNNLAKIPDNFNINIEACLNLSNQMLEKKLQN